MPAHWDETIQFIGFAFINTGQKSGKSASELDTANTTESHHDEFGFCVTVLHLSTALNLTSNYCSGIENAPSWKEIYADVLGKLHIHTWVGFTPCLSFICTLLSVMLKLGLTTGNSLHQTILICCWQLKAWGFFFLPKYNIVDFIKVLFLHQYPLIIQHFITVSNTAAGTLLCYGTFFTSVFSTRSYWKHKKNTQTDLNLISIFMLTDCVYTRPCFFLFVFLSSCVVF